MKGRVYQSRLTTTYRICFVSAIIISFGIWFYLLCNNPHGLQHKVFFSDANDWFMDYYNMLYYSVGRAPYSWGVELGFRNLLPLSYLILWPVTKLMNYDINDWKTSYAERYTQNGAIFFAIYLVISFLVVFYALYKCAKGKELSKISLLTALLLSGITLFNFDRANSVIITAGMLFIYILSLDSKSVFVRQMGLIMLALAAASKIFPCFFGVLLIQRKRYKEALLAIIYGLIAVFLPFVFLNGGFIENIKGFMEAVKRYNIIHNSVGFGFGGYTVLNVDAGNNILKYVGTGICLVSVLASHYIKEDWKKLMLLSLSMIMITNNQAIYTVIYLFYPIVVFFCSNRKPIDFLYVICFIAILIPLRFNVEVGLFIFNNIRVTNTIFIVLMIVFIAEGICNFVRDIGDGSFWERSEDSL